jgi:hypothetical protein
MLKQDLVGRGTTIFRARYQKLRRFATLPGEGAFVEPARGRREKPAEGRPLSMSRRAGWGHGVTCTRHIWRQPTSDGFEKSRGSEDPGAITEPFFNGATGTTAHHPTEPIATHIANGGCGARLWENA